MRRVFKWVGIALAVFVAIALSLPFLINVNQFKPVLESQLSAALNREVKLGRLKLSLFSGEVAADDLSVAEDQSFGKPAFLRAKSLRVGAEIWPFLISRKLIATYLAVDQPEIVLVQLPSGDWNFSSLGSKSKLPPANTPAPGAAPLDLSVKVVRISGGRVTLKRTLAHWKPLVLEQLHLELRDFSPRAAFPFTLSSNVAGGGSIRLNGTAGPIDPIDSAMTPMNASLEVARLDLAASGANDFAPELSGLISFEGTGSSDGRLMQLKGKLKAERLKLASKGTPASRSVDFDYAARHDLRNHAGTLRQGDIHIGAATAHLTGTYAEQGQSMVLHMKLSGPAMPIPELAALLPSLGVVLPAGSRLDGGTATVMLEMEGPADKLVTSGLLALNNTRLVGFDLPKKMAAIEKLAGIKAAPDTDIQTLSAEVRVAPEGTSAHDMRLVVPAIGELSGAGTVSPAKDLDFNMMAVVHGSGPLAALGNTPVPFTVQGTSADPVFRPDVKGIAREQLKRAEPALEKAAQGLVRGLFQGKKQ